MRDRVEPLAERIASTERLELAEQRALDVAVVALQRQRTAFGRRIVQVYEMPPNRYLDVLFGAHSFVDLTERLDDLRCTCTAMSWSSSR